MKPLATKYFSSFFGAVGLVASVIFSSQAKKPAIEEPWVLIVGGNTQGYLSPCGCTKPMVGGMRRRAQATQLLNTGPKTIFVDTGAFADNINRQDEMKAQTMAQWLGRTHVSAVNLTERDAKLGVGNLITLQELSGSKIISGSAEPVSGVKFSTQIQSGPFEIGGLSSRPESVARWLGSTAIPLDDGVRRFLSNAGRWPTVLLFDGDEAEARTLAKDNPGLKLIVYRSESDPPLMPNKQGKTWLVTPGEHGKNLVRLTFHLGEFQQYSVVKLGPEYSDEAAATRIYRSYLKRVDEENLLLRVPRDPGYLFSGSPRCGSCHAKAETVWKSSQHSHALATLENEGNGRDPDCVSCHVTGLNLTTGFRDRASTPSLANVGCESCHGAGESHSVNASLVKMPKVGEASCIGCHNVSHSPAFDFLTYWRKISH